MQSNCINNSNNKPKGVAYGAASLTRVLNGVCFPITRDEIIAKYGDREVQYSKGNLKTMKEIVSKCNNDSFYTMSELVEACARRPLKRN